MLFRSYISSTYEDYYTLSVEIKNQRNLDDSLERFIAESTVSDYQCSACHKRVDVAKRTLISTLPNVLIVHLQRFSYNFDTFMNEKIHSRLEFPNTLDMVKYTEEGHEEKVMEKEASINNNKNLEENEKENKDRFIHKESIPKKTLKDKEYYTYKLVGIVMHNGNAEAGHYYSYINTNRIKKEELKDYLNPEGDTWLEFNDSHISEFTFKNVESECFGGTLEDISNGYMDENSEVAKLIGGRSKSAYMLFYERRKKDMIPLRIKNEPSSLECDSTAVSRAEGKIYDKETGEIFQQFDYYGIPINIAADLVKVSFTYIYNRKLKLTTVGLCTINLYTKSAS